MTNTTKTRTITLTGRRPVKIVEDQWPVIASATGDSYRGNDYARHNQAAGQGELDEYRLTVRQHADGRAIVYGVFAGASAWTGNESRRGGQLLDAGDDLADAIRRVGEDCNLPDTVIRECVADLPAETIDTVTEDAQPSVCPANQRAWELGRRLWALTQEAKDLSQTLTGEAQEQADAVACALASVLQTISGPEIKFDLFVDAARDPKDQSFGA